MIDRRASALWMSASIKTPPLCTGALPSGRPSPALLTGLWLTEMVGCSPRPLPSENLRPGSPAEGGFMFLQLFQNASEFWNSMDPSTMILSVLASLLILALCWRWAKLAFESDMEPGRKRSKPRWPLRPSNLLFVLGFVISIYAVLHGPPSFFGLLSVSTRAPFMIFCLAFVIRYSENKALANFGDSKRDEEKVEDLRGKDGGLD
jgi:hypothetical protein